MTRCAWFIARWPFSMRELGGRLRAKQFAPEEAEGFFVERVRENEVSATYVRRIVDDSPRLDPFGQPMGGTEISYQRVNFVARSGAVGLELLNPPRGNQRFVSKLLEVCNFNLTIAPIRVDVDEWALAISKVLNVKAHADLAQYGSIDLGNGATARILVRGNGEVRDSAKPLLTLPSTVEKVQLRLGGSWAGSSIGLSRNGAAIVRAKEKAPLVEAVRATLEQLQQGYQRT